MTGPTTHREFTLGPSLLFCPADRPERFAKAADRADAIILDLEDAVAPANKAAARIALAEHFGPAGAAGADPGLRARTVVRVNAVGSPEFARDAERLAGLPVEWVMLPMAESDEDLSALGEFWPTAGVIALCETPAGVRRSEQIAAHPRVVALMWGAEDLIAALGGTSSRDAEGRYRDIPRHARAEVLFSAAVQGVAAVDAIHADIEDSTGLERESADAAAVGFSAKACIHPGHVQAIRTAFSPTSSELEYAQALLAECRRREEADEGSGAFTFRGSMVDAPLIRHAENIVQRSLR